jgi:hypothetical protein
VGAFVVTLANTVIDLFEPGQLLQREIADVQTSFATHAPFSWIAGLADALQQGISTTDSGLPTSFVVGTQTITIPWSSLESAIPTTWRPPLVALVWLGLALKLLDMVLSFMGWSRAVPVGTPEGDYA